MSACVPETVTLPEPLPVSVAAPAATTFSVPLTTPSETEEMFPSTSPTATPAMASGVSSTPLCAPGTVVVGESLTAVTVMATTPVPVPPLPSVAVMFSVSAPLKLALPRYPWTHPRHILPMEEDLSPLGAKEAKEDFEQGSLAAPIRAQQGDDLSRTNGQRYVSQHRRSRIAELDVISVDQTH